MRILYGVQGTGNGHLTRARSLGAELLTAGLEVDYLFSGRDRSKFFDMGLFGDFACLRGLSFVVHRGQIDVLRTMLTNRPVRLVSDIQNLDVSDYDLVISDFEPITAWAARNQNKKCISMSHQSAFDYAVPKVRGYPLSQALMRHFAPGSIKLGFHYYHFEQPVLPPLIGQQVAKPPVQNKIVVYMGFEELDDILNFISPFSNFEFQVFTHVSEKSQRENITINPISHDEFHAQLRDAGGVITNAGFALSSECLAMGKKLLVKPLHGQFEQLSNSLALQCLGRATIANELDQELLAEWLTLKPHTPIDYPDVAKLLADWIVNSESHNILELANQVWSGITFPYEYDSEFGADLVHGLLV
jgi:uncharacterized protein (TIGR00661 family)